MFTDEQLLAIVFRFTVCQDDTSFTTWETAIEELKRRTGRTNSDLIQDAVRQEKAFRARFAKGK